MLGFGNCLLTLFADTKRRSVFAVIIKEKRSSILQHILSGYRASFRTHEITGAKDDSTPLPWSFLRRHCLLTLSNIFVPLPPTHTRTISGGFPNACPHYCLIHPRWTKAGQAALYRRVILISAIRYARFQDSLLEYPENGAYVREIQILWGSEHFGGPEGFPTPTLS